MGRLGRAENFLDTHLDNNRSRSMDKSPSTSRSELNTEVYRDKNTLVEVTIHRRPREKDPRKETSLYARPTASSLTKSKPSPGKLRKSIKSVDDGHIKKETREHKKDQRSVKEILGELRDIVKISGIDQVHDFIDEIDKPVRSKGNSKPQEPKIPLKLCQKPDNSAFETKIQSLENECQKYKAEAGRYKHEYGVMVKQVEISKDTVKSLEAQVNDLKKIVSRLTKNNGELLDIVSEKINYEDMIADLEKNKAVLVKQLSDEKSQSAMIKERLDTAEAEVAGLRALSAEVRAGVRHGLAGLEIARPDTRQDMPALGDNTKHILGIKDGEDEKSETEDSAFDDPNTESLRSRPKSGQRKEKESAKPLAPLLKHPIEPQQPGPVSEVFRLSAPTIPFSPPTKMSSYPNKPQTFLPPPPPTTTTVQSRSSTMVESPTHPAFQPLPLDLSETVSECSSVMVEKQALPLDPDVPEKQSLEIKVSSFLSRLRQDSLHLQNIPQAEPFPGPSMHLSLSSSDMDQDNTRQSIDTTITEGRFLRGLETPIEVLQAESTKNSD